MPGHGGNRTYDLWNTSPMLCQLRYAVRSVRVCDISEQNLLGPFREPSDKMFGDDFECGSDVCIGMSDDFKFSLACK